MNYGRLVYKLEQELHNFFWGIIMIYITFKVVVNKLISKKTPIRSYKMKLDLLKLIIFS